MIDIRDESTYERTGVLLANARIKHNKSQQYMADHLNLSRRTVIRIENGETVPDVVSAIKWFEILGESAMPYFLAFIYPENSFNANNIKDLKIIARNISQIVMSLPADDQKELYYILNGNHGSSVHAVINLAAEHCHLPLNYRIISAEATHACYKLASEDGSLIGAEEHLPDYSVDSALSDAHAAHKDGRDSYI